MFKIRYNKLSAIQRKLAQDACYFCIKKFCPRLVDKIQIRVQGIENLLDKEDVFADCDFEDTHNRLPREFIIRIDNTLDLYVFLRVLMHEMVHVKQWAKGEMRQIKAKKITYKWFQNRIELDTIDYWDHPWEIEAHGRENGLMYQFFANDEYWRGFFNDEIEDSEMQRPTQMVR